MRELEDGTVLLTREELYERVWTTAMRTLGPQLGITDVGLAKTCRRFAIPTPPLGYWAKKQHGKAPPRPPLPPWEGSPPEPIAFRPDGVDAVPRSSDAVQQYEQQEKAADNRIVVPPLLASPHPLVARTLQSLQAAGRDADGLIKPRARNTLTVQVAPASVDRAVRILDALVKALQARSLPIAAAPAESHAANTVHVLGEILEFGLYEGLRQEERRPTRSERLEMMTWPASRRTRKYHRNVPTGRLSLDILSGPANGRKRRFADTASQPLEKQLNAFIACLFQTAEDIQVERKRLEDLRRQQEEAERQRQEHERLRHQKIEEIRQEEEQLQLLLQQAEAWRKSQEVRRFIRTVRRMVESRSGPIPPGSDTDRWLAWAQQHADRMDPLVESPPSILDEKSRWQRRDCS